MKPCWWLGLAYVISGCGSPDTSTGVGNPGVISLSIVTDDELEPNVGQADLLVDGGALDAASDGSDGDGGTVDAGTDGAPPNTEDRLPKSAIFHAVLVLGELRWLPCDGTLATTVVRGPFVVDFVTGRTAPPVPPVPVPNGGFCGIDAPLAPALAPPALVGRSLLFDGVRADGTPFLVYAEMRAVLRLRPRPGMAWNGTLTPAVLWAFRPRRWLIPSELDALTPIPWDDQRLAIVIDADRHPLLYLAIRARLAGRSTLYPDRNRNGIIDQDERDFVGEGLDNAD